MSQRPHSIVGYQRLQQLGFDCGNDQARGALHQVYDEFSMLSELCLFLNMHACGLVSGCTIQMSNTQVSDDDMHIRSNRKMHKLNGEFDILWEVGLCRTTANQLGTC